MTSQQFLMTSQQLIDKILSADKCGDIFEKASVKNTFRQYAKIVHPDICTDPRAQEAFTKLNKLYESALDCLAHNAWEQTGYFQVSPKLTLIGVKHIDPFELGARYVTDDKLVYIFDSGKDKYVQQYITKAKNIRYENDKMRDTYKPRMPTFPSLHSDYISMTAGRKAIVLSKTEDQYPMDLFMKAYQKDLTGRDIAWMISRMCDLLCFLHYNGTVLNGFTKENLFISPKYHSISILGGWWYATEIGQKMLGTSKTVYNCMSFLARTNKVSEYQTDVESMRYICQEIVKGKPGIPEPILKWINKGSGGYALPEYLDWNEALDKAYGVRRFVKFEEDPRKIYDRV